MVKIGGVCFLPPDFVEHTHLDWGPGVQALVCGSMSLYACYFVGSFYRITGVNGCEVRGPFYFWKHFGDHEYVPSELARAWVRGVTVCWILNGRLNIELIAKIRSRG